MLIRGGRGEMKTEEHREAHGERWAFSTQGMPGRGHISSIRGLSLVELLVLISWIIGLVTGHSYKPFPVKYVVVFS